MPHIKVWRFHEAPEIYKSLSPHGGDEDWLALVPPHMANDCIPWMEAGTAFGVYRVSDCRMEDGSVVRIGAHA